MATPYDRDNFDHRHKLATLRVEAMKQVILLALASMAILTALAGAGFLPHGGGSFWTLSAIGVLLDSLSAFSAIIFLTSAPNFVQHLEREFLLNTAYVAAVILMVSGTISLIVAALVAFFSK